MKSLAAFATFFLLPAVASAEGGDLSLPAHVRHGYVGVGMAVGADRAFNLGVYLDGGGRLGDTPIFARGQISGGAAGDEGEYSQLRAGLEARGCVLHDIACGFAGVDAGYQRAHVVDHPLFSGELYEVDADDLMVAPRAGLELGHKLRVRTTLELPTFVRLDDRMDSAPERTALGITMSAGLVGAF